MELPHTLPHTLGVPTREFEQCVPRLASQTRQASRLHRTSGWRRSNPLLCCLGTGRRSHRKHSFCRLDPLGGLHLNKGWGLQWSLSNFSKFFRARYPRFVLIDELPVTIAVESDQNEHKNDERRSRDDIEVSKETDAEKGSRIEPLVKGLRILFIIRHEIPCRALR